MSIIRVYYDSNALWVDTIEIPFVAGTLTATKNADGVTIDITRVDGTYIFLSPQWQQIADENYNTFGSANEVMAYLQAQMTMRRPLGFAYSSEAALVWTITHELGFFPNVTVTDTAGDPLLADPRYPDLNTVVVTFGQPTAGTAYLS